MSITLHDIYVAYRKFKTFVYYNGQPLNLRERLARFELDMLSPDDKSQEVSDENLRKDFESKFSEKFQPLLEVLDGNDGNGTFKGWLDGISSIIVPKQLREAEPCKEHFISNEVPNEEYNIEKFNLVIDAPIELFIISTLWLMRLGKRLSHLISNDNYAYRLSIFDNLPDSKESEDSDATPISSGLMLYDPYFIGYQQWRDNGLNKVSQTLDNHENAVILSLDIKRYFYNVKINVTDIVRKYIGENERVDKDEEILCSLLQDIHLKYASLFPNHKSGGVNVMLPIGLPSSGFLGNLCLKPFDDYIRNHVTPAYYGRYVDDILMVFSGKGMKITRNPESHSYIDGFITDHLVRVSGNNAKSSQAIFSRKYSGSHIQETSHTSRKKKPDTAVGSHDPSNTDSTEKDIISYISYGIKIEESDFEIQLGKVIMEFFNCNESRAAVNKFKKQLEKNRSEFRYLPWEEEINLEFDDEAFRLEISDSVNKIRNIQGISEDKYGASTYLAKKIFLSILPFESSSKQEKEASARQILTYFKGRTTILMNSLWEKVATYFVVNNQPKHLEHFWNQTMRAIDKTRIEVSDIEENNMPDATDIEIREALREHLKISTAMAISIAPGILKECFRNKAINRELKEMSMNFRSTYLFRHQYQYVKGYCFTLHGGSEKSLTGSNLISERIDGIMPSYAPYVSPVFLKPHEIMILHIYHKLSGNHLILSESTSPLIDTESMDKTFRRLNYEWRDMFSGVPMVKDDISTKFFRECLKVETVEYSNPLIRLIEIKDETTDKEYTPDKKVGIVNWKIEESDLVKSICGNPNKSNKRREKLFEVLNYSSRKHVEMLVFPETSIPVEWMPLMVEQAVRNDCALIGGFEYYVTPGRGEKDTPGFLEDMYVFNFSFNIFPVRMNCYDTAAIILRKKNYYAPAEQNFISAYHKLEPKLPSVYHLIHWRRSYFSTYNCFELSNISDRSIFKSKVDFLAAIEYNRDTHYFANITEAWTRDLHCFIVQSNSSDYGDTKVVQPTKNVNMNLMKIKGGDYPLVMVTTLQIDRLRKYHRKRMIGQLDDQSSPYFKPTPACYDWKWAERRILDDSLSPKWFASDIDS